MYPIIIYMYMCGIDVWPQIYWTNKLKYTVIIIILKMYDIIYVCKHAQDSRIWYMVHNFSIFLFLYHISASVHNTCMCTSACANHTVCIT